MLKKFYFVASIVESPSATPKEEKKWHRFAHLKCKYHSVSLNFENFFQQFPYRRRKIPWSYFLYKYLPLNLTFSFFKTFLSISIVFALFVWLQANVILLTWNLSLYDCSIAFFLRLSICWKLISSDRRQPIVIKTITRNIVARSIILYLICWFVSTLADELVVTTF